MANTAVERPTIVELKMLKDIVALSKYLGKKFDISPMGTVLFWYSCSNYDGDMNITVISEGDGSYTVRKFSGPLIDTEGSGNQDEHDSKTLPLEQAMALAKEWQDELEEE